MFWTASYHNDLVYYIWKLQGIFMYKASLFISFAQKNFIKISIHYYYRSDWNLLK